MDTRFFERPILNSPVRLPGRHWELDADGQPTGRIIETRREAPSSSRRSRGRRSASEPGRRSGSSSTRAPGVSTAAQQYDPTPIINELRSHVDQWRAIAQPEPLGRDARDGAAPPALAAPRVRRHPAVLLPDRGGRDGDLAHRGGAERARTARRFLDHLANANDDANPELLRLALKLATGAGKTTVMAMLIAWQTVNAVRRPQSKRFTRGFLVVTPGITIKDRLRVLQPNDPDSYYASRELVPGDMLDDVERAKIVITNYHAFKRRERIELSKGGRALLQGRAGEELDTLETEGQMLQRVMPELMGLKNILVLNDEAHHCYREKPAPTTTRTISRATTARRAERNNEAARALDLRARGGEPQARRSRASSTSPPRPFFLRGSGYAEGTLFPWTMSDFSLMDAIECGIVKLPRVPVAENIPGDDMPMFRNLWENIRKDMPKKGRGKAGDARPARAATRLQTALQALYGHYEKTFDAVGAGEDRRPAVLHRRLQQHLHVQAGLRLHLRLPAAERRRLRAPSSRAGWPSSATSTSTATRCPRPNTLLIDSEQLESGEALDDDFRDMAADEIERFRREIVERTGDRREPPRT